LLYFRPRRQTGSTGPMIEAVVEEEVTTTNKITYLDGIRLHRALVAGIREVIARQDYLNKINVFPVPDRDTGTNMALTLNAVIEGTYTFYKPEINHLLERVADSALNGARGNSGAILAQFFQGFSEGAQDVHKKMTTRNFVSAVAMGVNFAHRALSQPQEGTILTVMRDFSDEMTRQQLENDDIDFVVLVARGLESAQVSLQRTSQQIKALRKAGVVDAGAQGLVDLIRGIYEFIVDGSIDDLNDEGLKPVDITIPDEELKVEIDEKYQFCTECLILGTDIDHNELRDQLNELGNCLIIAGSKRKTKIHMHVNDPTRVFEICRTQGRVIGEKADDMIHQQKSFNHREGTVAILTDSGADFPEGMVAQLDIHVVPIVINFGNKTFLDKVSMTAPEFYHELRRNKNHPKTSQPSFGDFHRQYQYLSSHYNSTIAIHLPGAASGTIEASKKAAEKSNKDAETNVVDSMSFSAGQGLIVRYAAEAAKSGMEHADIVKAINNIIPKTHAYAALTQLDFVVRGGRIPEKIKKIADLFRLTPVVTIKGEGKLGTGWLLLGRKNLAKKFTKKIKKNYPTSKTYRIAIMHTNNKAMAVEFSSFIKKAYPNLDSLDIVDCGAALGAHAGPGAVGIAIQEYVPLPKKLASGDTPASTDEE
jgi:DegV family protein with EDD domain